MPKSLPIYLLSIILGFVALFCGLTGKKLPLINDTKSAVIILALAGIIMCSTGIIGQFVTKAPFHPLTIIGYVLGVMALFIAIVHFFGIKLPIFSEPRNALIIIALIIVVKVVIGRLNFLLK